MAFCRSGSSNGQIPKEGLFLLALESCFEVALVVQLCVGLYTCWEGWPFAGSQNGRGFGLNWLARDGRCEVAGG